jgi:hypothetical protein
VVPFPSKVTVLMAYESYDLLKAIGFCREQGDSRILMAIAIIAAILAISTVILKQYLQIAANCVNCHKNGNNSNFCRRSINHFTPRLRTEDMCFWDPLWILKLRVTVDHKMSLHDHRLCYNCFLHTNHMCFGYNCFIVQPGLLYPIL